jgi:hypothetical protein
MPKEMPIEILCPLRRPVRRGADPSSSPHDRRDSGTVASRLLSAGRRYCALSAIPHLEDGKPHASCREIMLTALADDDGATQLEFVVNF